MTERLFGKQQMTQSSELNGSGIGWVDAIFFDGLGVAAALSLAAVIPAGLVAGLLFFLSEDPARYSIFSAE